MSLLFYHLNVSHSFPTVGQISWPAFPDLSHICLLFRHSASQSLILLAHSSTLITWLTPFETWLNCSTSGDSFLEPATLLCDLYLSFVVSPIASACTSSTVVLNQGIFENVRRHFWLLQSRGKGVVLATS